VKLKAFIKRIIDAAMILLLSVLMAEILWLDAESV